MEDQRLKVCRPGPLTFLDELRHMGYDYVLLDTTSDAFFLKGKVTAAGKVAVRLDFACTLANAPAGS